ncbi:MAG: head maturation protease, ClpP-related [Amphiplicatus sp.]
MGAASPAFAIELYGDIGMGDIYARDVSRALKAAKDASEIDLRINSAGGDVFEGVAIYEALQRFPGRVTAHVDGLAASAASFIAMAADEIRIAPAGFIMIHPAQGLGIGPAETMRQMADTLDKITARIAQAYSARTGVTEDKALALMAAETWFDAEEAVAAGFADRLSEAPKRRIAARYDPSLHQFRNMPDAVRKLIAGAQESRAKDRAASRDAYLTRARIRVNARSRL